MDFEASETIYYPLVDIIFNNSSFENYDRRSVDQLKFDVRTSKEERYRVAFLNISEQLQGGKKSCLEQAKEKGSSSWLTSLPLESQGYTLNKREFRDAISLRYGWEIDDIPQRCPCGTKNDVDHTLTCALGGYVHLRHNNIRDLIAEMLRDAHCRDVQVEPTLLPVNPAT